MKNSGWQKITARVIPVVILGVTVGLLYIHYQQVVKLKETAFELLVLKTHQQERTALKRLFDPIVSNLSIAGRSVQAESPDLGDIQTLNARFMPILEELTQIASAMVADSDGREYLLMRTEQGWLTRLTDAQRWSDQVQWSRWEGSGDAVEQWQERLDYDPRRRPWYRGAADSVEQQQVFWTAPYRFFTRQVPGITAASRWRHPSAKGKILVVAFDVLLTDISTLTTALSSTATRRTFILSEQGQILGIPGDPQIHDSGALQASIPSAAEAFPLAIVRDTYAQWLSRGRPAGEPFVF